MNKAGKVSIHVKDMPLKDALSICFANLPITFLMVENTIVLKEKSTNVKSDALVVERMLFTLQGKVIDTSGAPLEGVTIFVKETKAASVTDGDGNFKIDVNAGQTMSSFTRLLDQF